MSLGAVCAPEGVLPGPLDGPRVDADPVRCADPATSQAMVAEIDAVKKDGDTLGGVVEVVGYGLPPGLGSHVHWDRRLDGRLAAALMSIQAIKGVEVGDGFTTARRRGSQAHDEIEPGAGGIRRTTNRAGGIEGGMSTGEVLRVRAAMKPISTVPRALATVDVRTGEPAKAIIKVQEQNLLVADIAAHRRVSQAQKALIAAVAALAAARARGTVYPAIPGPLFTVDTNLTLPSGETAASLDQFLSGSALAGLGASFIRAEATYHVSARYFVAHAILESGWGTSSLAQYKHNLFGFGANDRNPYGDAMSFASFDACIQYVAQFIQSNYLTPGGRFYHGPTLRGMNVDYASDPNWATKIASIADTIPPLAVP